MKTDGWSLNEEGVDGLLEGNTFNVHQAQQEILNSDLKEVGSPCLPDLQKGKGNSIPSPVVLQVSKVRNISAPKAFEESGSAPRLLKVSLTDGFTTIHALEMQNIKPLSLKTAPGTKVRLSGTIVVNGGFVLLNPNNISVIGGTVQELFDKWKLSSSVSKFNRIVRATDGSGPPAWVPFGKRIEKKNAEEMRHFKSLKDTDKDKGNDEFESQRKQAVKELAKEGQGKVFGGGKMMLDANVQKVINAGFSQEVAEWALRHNKNDPVKAIRELKASASGQSASNESNYNNRKTEDDGGYRGRGGRGRNRGRGRGRGGGGPDGSDDDYEPPPNMPRPSGPASLFDFLDSKMIEKKETIKFADPVPDVRGPANHRGRGGRGLRGRHGDGRNDMNNSSVNGSVSPPNLTTENWPAPGEEKPPPSNRTYIESKELMEEKEHQENLAMMRQFPKVASSSGREYQPPAYRNGYGGQQNYGRENGDSRDTGNRQDYDNSQRDYYYQENRGRGGRRGFRGGGGYGGGGYGTSGGGNYRGEADGAYRYNEGGRGGRGNSNSGSRRDGSYSGNNYYRGDYNTNYRGNDGDSGNIPNRGNVNRGDTNHYDNRYNYSNNSQRTNRGRGGTGNRGPQELIKDFQNSMVVSRHYQNIADGNTAPSHGRYNDGDYSQFSGTLEFHRGGGRRGGRGAYN